MKLSKEDIGLISKFELCNNMDTEDLMVLAKHVSIKSYSSGEMLFHQASKENDHLFIILEGNLDIITALDEFGRTMVISSQQAGAVAGILSFIDGRAHKASAKAMSPVRVAIISREDFEHFKDSHATVATKLLQYLIVSADDLACQLMNKLSRSQSYINGTSRSLSIMSSYVSQTRLKQ